MTIADSIAETLGTIFATHPSLSGFTVQERAALSRDREARPLGAGLAIADVSVDSWTGFHDASTVCDDIRNAIEEILENHPEADGLIRGATFARVFH